MSLGRYFVIRTDHSALQSLRRTAEPIGQQARWQAFIEQFNFVIMHRPGTKHRNADALSRRPSTLDSGDGDGGAHCAAVTVGPQAARQRLSTETHDETPTGQSMSELQNNDWDIGPILRLRLQQLEQPHPEEVLSGSEATKALWGQWHCLVLRNDVLYRVVNAKYGRPATLQLIVPASRRTEFIRRCHEGMTGGHRAFLATLHQVQRRGFWPGWRRDVQRYCRQCIACCRYHR